MMLSETSQTKTNTRLISFIYEILETTVTTKLIDAENRLEKIDGCQKWGSGGQKKCVKQVTRYIQKILHLSSIFLLFTG